MERLLLATPVDFSFRATVSSHGWRSLAPYHWVEERGWLHRVEQLASGKVVALTLADRSADSSGSGISVDVAGHLSPAERLDLADRLRWALALELPLAEFHDYATAIPELAHVPQERVGRLLRGTSVFEDVVKTILTTNVTWNQTKSMATRLVAAFGEPVLNASSDTDAMGALPSGDGSADGTRSVAHAFPTPAALAASGEKELARLAGVGYRAKALARIAADVASGALDLEGYRERAATTEPAALRKELTALPGIGPYAAAHLTVLFGHYDRVPVDSWARRLYSVHRRGGEPVTDSEVHEFFARHGRWAFLAYRFFRWELEAEEPRDW